MLKKFGFLTALLIRGIVKPSMSSPGLALARLQRGDLRVISSFE
jgi:hypothetical protein